MSFSHSAHSPPTHQNLKNVFYTCCLGGFVGGLFVRLNEAGSKGSCIHIISRCNSLKCPFKHVKKGHTTSFHTTSEQTDSTCCEIHLERLSIRTPCLVSVSLESILMLNSLSSSRTKEMAPVSGFMYSRHESFTTSQLHKHKHRRNSSREFPKSL